MHLRDTQVGPIETRRNTSAPNMKEQIEPTDFTFCSQAFEPIGFHTMLSTCNVITVRCFHCAILTPRDVFSDTAY